MKFKELKSVPNFLFQGERVNKLSESNEQKSAEYFVRIYVVLVILL